MTKLTAWTIFWAVALPTLLCEHRVIYGLPTQQMQIKTLCLNVYRFCLLAIGCGWLATPIALVATPADPPHDPLFANEEPLTITLQGPFKTLDKKRDKTAEYDAGVLSYEGPNGPVSIASGFSPRGNFRLEKTNCSHAQLWLNLKKKQTHDTLFSNQKKLKLVVQCRDSTRYRSYLRKEYQAYRMLNLLTDVSHRVRWVNVTYENLDGKTLRSQPAFLIEHKNRVADRLGLNTVDEQRIDRKKLDPPSATTAALFNYFIGNADFSLIASAEGSCCHNAKLLQADDEAPYIPVVYDFDSSGYVDAPYAITPANLKLRSVRQRIYRGFCTEPAVFDAALDKFRTHREALLAIAGETDMVSKRQARKSVAYLDDFYEVIDDPKRLADKIIEVCR